MRVELARQDEQAMRVERARQIERARPVERAILVHLCSTEAWCPAGVVPRSSCLPHHMCMSTTGHRSFSLRGNLPTLSGRWAQRFALAGGRTEEATVPMRCGGMGCVGGVGGTGRDGGLCTSRVGGRQS